VNQTQEKLYNWRKFHTDGPDMERARRADVLSR